MCVYVCVYVCVCVCMCVCVGSVCSVMYVHYTLRAALVSAAVFIHVPSPTHR